MKAAPMTVVETPFFLRKAASLMDDGARSKLVLFLATNPEVGDIVPETGGVRKFRWAIQGNGKSGGVRVIYYFHNQAFPLFLLTVYGKSQKANLSKAERNDLKKHITRLIKTYSQSKLL